MTGTEILNLLRDLGVFGLAMFFIQLVITKSADRKFEFYKTELDYKTREFQTTLDSKIELYKAELSLQHYKSTQTYELQLKAIIEMHRILSKLNRDVKEMTTLLKTATANFETEETQRINKAIASYNSFLIFFEENLIFFPQKTADKVEKIRNDYMESIIDYNFGKNFSGGDRKFIFEKYKEANDRVKERTQPAINQLAIDFRELIGIEKLLAEEKTTQVTGSAEE